MHPVHMAVANDGSMMGVAVGHNEEGLHLVVMMIVRCTGRCAPCVTRTVRYRSVQVASDRYFVRIVSERNVTLTFRLLRMTDEDVSEMIPIARHPCRHHEMTSLHTTSTRHDLNN